MSSEPPAEGASATECIDALLERMADLEQRVLFLESEVNRIDADRQALRAELAGDIHDAETEL